MARKSATSIENNLTKGLITEATGLNFPENACTETWDCIFDRSGKVTRRPGFSVEATPNYTNFTRSNTVFVEYVWKNAGGQAGYDFLVRQVGLTLAFYRLPSGTSFAVATGRQAFTVNLASFQSSIFAPTDQPCAFATGNGYLFVANAWCDPFYVHYNTITNAITATEITIQVRDLDGVIDGLGVDERPATLSDNHHYNLLNQGWGEIINTAGTFTALTSWQLNRSDEPANADIWWLFRNDEGAFNSTTAATFSTGTTHAPRGRHILDAFIENRAAYVAAVSPGTGGSSIYRPSTISFFAGRVWYGGVNYERFSGRVYFSQILDDVTKSGKCYQEQDPCAEHSADLLATDGGVVSVQDIGIMYKMIPSNDGLYIFASNGVWKISGSEGIGFRANDYSVIKVSNIGCISPHSFIEIEGGTIMWWNYNAIYALDTASGQVANITNDTIKTFYSAIPRNSKLWAKAAYNPLSKVVRWVYKSTATTGADTSQQYDRVLNFDFGMQIFYPWTIGTSTTFVNGIVGLEMPAITATWYPVSSLVSGTTYQASLATVGSGSFLDWTNVNYTSYLISGYKIHGDGNKDIQSNYITVYLENDDEDNSLFVRGVWDYSKNVNTKRWSTSQQAYNFQVEDDYDVVFKRLKIRGHGKAFQIYCSSEQGKPFTLLGWAIQESSNSQV
jgi:hypothetical protein